MKVHFVEKDVIKNYYNRESVIPSPEGYSGYLPNQFSVEKNYVEIVRRIGKKFVQVIPNFTQTDGSTIILDANDLKEEEVGSFQSLDWYKPVLDRLFPDRWMVFTAGDHNYILVHHPSITIVNSHNESHTVTDLVVMYAMYDYKIVNHHPFGFRLSFNDNEVKVGYVHSHLRQNQFGPNTFCTGSGSTFNNQLIGCTSSRYVTPEQFEMLLLSTNNYLKWESLDGVPYTHIRNLRAVQITPTLNGGGSHISGLPSNPFRYLTPETRFTIRTLRAENVLGVLGVELLFTSEFSELLVKSPGHAGVYTIHPSLTIQNSPLRREFERQLIERGQLEGVCSPELVGNYSPEGNGYITSAATVRAPFTRDQIKDQIHNFFSSNASNLTAYSDVRSFFDRLVPGYPIIRTVPEDNTLTANAVRVFKTNMRSRLELLINSLLMYLYNSTINESNTNNGATQSESSDNEGTSVPVSNSPQPVSEQN